MFFFFKSTSGHRHFAPKLRVFVGFCPRTTHQTLFFWLFFFKTTCNRFFLLKTSSFNPKKTPFFVSQELSFFFPRFCFFSTHARPWGLFGYFLPKKDTFTPKTQPAKRRLRPALLLPRHSRQGGSTFLGLFQPKTPGPRAVCGEKGLKN